MYLNDLRLIWAFRVNIYYCIGCCRPYLLHRRPVLKAIPENAWLMLTGLLVIQSELQCLYISGQIVWRLKECESCGFCKYNWIYYALLFRGFYFIILFSYECFVVHWNFKLKQVTLVTLLLNVQSIKTDM